MDLFVGQPMQLKAKKIQMYVQIHQVFNQVSNKYMRSYGSVRLGRLGGCVVDGNSLYGKGLRSRGLLLNNQAQMRSLV